MPKTAGITDLLSVIEKDKEDITEIIYEPWHLRYVGVQIAQYMHENNLCLEEFTNEWKEAAAAYQAAEN